MLDYLHEESTGIYYRAIHSFKGILVVSIIFHQLSSYIFSNVYTGSLKLFKFNVYILADFIIKGAFILLMFVQQAYLIDPIYLIVQENASYLTGCIILMVLDAIVCNLAHLAWYKRAFNFTIQDLELSKIERISLTIDCLPYLLGVTYIIFGYESDDMFNFFCAIVPVFMLFIRCVILFYWFIGLNFVIRHRIESTKLVEGL